MQRHATVQETPAGSDWDRRLLREAGKRIRDFDPLPVELLFGLARTFALVEARLASFIQRRSLSLAGLNVLSILRACGKEGCPLNQLSRLLLVTPANITGLMDVLDRKGFVRRDRHKTDRRIILATITKEGERFLDHYLPQHHRQVRRAMAGLGRRDMNRLIGLLSKLRRHNCPASPPRVLAVP